MSYISGRAADEVVAASHAAISGAVQIFWLLGKVQSGRSSIVRAVTGCSDIEIGVGFKPCTETARLFEYLVDAPLIRCLDTRGLGEVSYNPAADIALAEGQANILLVVMNALDQQQRAVLDVVKTVRGRHLQWSLVVAQTTLHADYARSARHPMPYPFDTPDPVRWEAAGVPPHLVRSVLRQWRLFDGVPNGRDISFVALDFTRPNAGYDPKNYGLSALIPAVRETETLSVATSLRAAAPADVVPACCGKWRRPMGYRGMVKRSRSSRHVWAPGSRFGCSRDSASASSSNSFPYMVRPWAQRHSPRAALQPRSRLVKPRSSF
jgi:hypothetical protein